MSLNWDARKCGPEWAALDDNKRTELILDPILAVVVFALYMACLYVITGGK